MSYQVLARKWRPRKFAEMVGQEHVLRALINALDNDRLHHAYLFTGTRGVGKTTVARIFAKSLNCESGVSAEPCGECSACVEIDEGRFVDLIEVDAASRTKVEDTRELLDNVQYAPTRGRYKVYLIDEVHMLSAHSFNALLKTLEEPPPHVKFLLATTDPQKLPATVLSRCLQFNLKRLPMPLISGHLETLLKAESVTAEVSALQLLARAADGSMRDALSLLDQAIAFGDGGVSEADVRSMLGTIERGHVTAILRALADADAPALLAVIEQLSQQAPDYEGLLAELLTDLQQIAIAQVAAEAVDADIEARETLLELAQRMDPEDVQLYYQIGLVGRRDLPLSPDPRGGMEMILLRMLAFRPVTGEQPQVAARPLPSRKAGASATAPSNQANTSGKPVAAPATSAAPQPRLSEDADWSALVDCMQLKGMLRELAMNCAVETRDGGHWKLMLDSEHQQLLSKTRQQQLEERLGECMGKDIKLDIGIEGASSDTPAQKRQREAEQRQAGAVEAITSDPNVKAFQKSFGATLHDETIRPRDT
ncbi:DNA polymerase-3 subunit gamma/tau [Thiogranum longum]|uniref:DNA polymerase III subunit gamma/tau n=1 Tax=Thiogranum longum TaxID=1537524 RepID=A0A4V2PGS1_9GAMM|nr:DNA polymerase III subunit gamma/tau [Thiogranum longum]TCK17896.1 DNA polymerase-3 subunit gamma/tau [Thiogranum longum]